MFDCVDDAYWVCPELITTVVNDHAPLKKRVIKHHQVPYMNSELRKSINVRNMLKRKFDQCKDYENWERYRRQRNIVIKLRKKSLSLYLKTKCN